MATLKFAAIFKDCARAEHLARRYRGQLFVDERAASRQLPIAALVTASTDDLAGFLAATEAGAYLIYERVIKSRSAPDTLNFASATPDAPVNLPGFIGLFPLVAHPDLGHTNADQYWRDQHAPLALQVHEAMSHYRQLSIVHRFHGPALDGVALCGFDSLLDLRERFYATEVGRQAIATDISQFADTAKSPRRMIVAETHYG